MSDLEKRIAVVREWVFKAENDLKTAAHTLKLGDECPTDTVCFHAQQCVEKHIKAVLVFRSIYFPKSLESLVALLPRRTKVELSVPEQRKLTDYAPSSCADLGDSAGSSRIRESRGAVLPIPFPALPFFSSARRPAAGCRR